jgi:hypothetical protein
VERFRPRGPYLREAWMVRLRQISILTLLWCTLPFAANRPLADEFEIWHQTSYIYMHLPGTLGQSTGLDWWFDSAGDDLQAFGLPVVGDPDHVIYRGTAQTGPLLSLDAKWDADGSIGYAEYLFGEGTFALELAFDLLDGTPHTMNIRGTLGPTSVRADDYSSNEIILSFLHAKIDPKSAALFGVKRQISGSTYYYTDVYDMGSRDRELALFGYDYFDYSVKNQKSADLTAVPEPGMLSLIGVGVAVAIRRRRTRHA